MMCTFSHRLLSTVFILVLMTAIMKCGPLKSGQDISNQCYLCLGTKKGEDNIAKCSIQNNLEVEKCPTEDMFDKCLVFQAFSLKMNTTIFRRECSSKRFCPTDVVCADHDFVDCKARCCSGDMCNDFDFEGETTRPVEETKELPLMCYFCDKDKDGKDSTNLCPANSETSVETCPIDEELPYSCLSLQTYSAETNTMTAVRKCLPNMLCTRDILCAYSDECNYTCCADDLCNDHVLVTSEHIDASAARTQPPAVEKGTSEPTAGSYLDDGTEAKADRCYYCIGEKQGVDNIAACSVQRALETEHCLEREPGIDSCLVYQAFSVQKNSTIFRRECMASQQCNKETLCGDPDLKDCRFDCCTGNYCNDFNFDMGTSRVTATVKLPVVGTTSNTDHHVQGPEKPGSSAIANTGTTTKCYYCFEEGQGEDNIAACSDQSDLPTEYCSAEDHFDRCMTYQAFSVKKSTIVFRRECASERFCRSKTMCGDPDHVDCRLKCCFGDHCNTFNFEGDPRRPTAAGGGDNGGVGGPRSPFEPATEGPIDEQDELDYYGCFDKDPLCPIYAANAEALKMFCKKNDRYTMYACRKTCNFCTGTEENIASSSRPAGPDEYFWHTTESSDNENTDASYGPTKEVSAEISHTGSEPVTLESQFPIKTYRSHTSYGPTKEVSTENSPTDSEPVTLENQFPIKTYRSHDLSTKDMSNTQDSDCKDLRDDCHTVVNNTGYCDYTEEYMVIHCQKSCNMCGEARGKPTEKPQSGIGVNTTPEEKPELPAQGCKDLRDDCHTIINNTGYCYYEKEYMAIYCQKSCNMCSEATDKSTKQPPSSPSEPDNKPGGPVVVTDEPPTKEASPFPNVPKVNYVVDWIIGPWGQCVNGKQERTVQCYHFLGGRKYQIVIDICIQRRGPMADMEQSC